jgi:hypothetical protein
MVVPRSLDRAVHQGEIELALFGFQQFPVDGGQDGVIDRCINNAIL